MALEPSLWGTLPKELLHLVFAHLLVAGIGKLRVHSKEWKRNVDCKDSEFNQVFDAIAHLNMFALLPWRHFSKFGIIYDVQANKWRVYESNAIFEKVETFDGADGGLVCCVSQRRWCYNKPGLFIVMNPLTKQKTQLPPLPYIGVEKSSNLIRVLRTVKLTIDKKTSKYKVFVVGSIANGGGGFFAQVYDSHIKEWMVVEKTQGYIIGWDYLNSGCSFAFPCGLCVYNCEDGLLQHFNGTNIAPGLHVKPNCCVLLQNHLFVLHKEAYLGPPDLLSKDGASMLSEYCISEFHLSKKTTTWVKLRVHSCSRCKCFFEKSYDIIHLRLWGCTGFLLIYGLGSKPSWLYNLSTCEWRKLPTFGRCLYPKLMCTISWSATA